jgi:hypothetical protein
MGLTQKLGTIPLAILTDSSNNVGIGAAANASFKLQVTGATNLTGALTGAGATFSGNVGIGATLSAWISSADVLQLNNTSALYAPTDESILSNNVFVDSGDNNKYITTNFASQYRQVSGQHLFYSAASGTASNTISFGTPKLAITSGGNVGIGTSPAQKLQVDGRIRVSGDNVNGGDMAVNDGGLAFSTIGATPIQFFTSNYTNERMRITSGGNVLIGDTGDYLSSKLNLKSADSTSSTNIIACRNSSGTDYFRVRSDGYTYALGVYNNTTGSGANVFVGAGGDFLRSTSSLKYKNSIRDYDKGLDIVNQLRPVYYKGNNDGDTIFAGLIAEEVHELGLTEFVQYAEDGTPDALAYQNMIALAFKAIQEQQAQIEELKAKIK